MRLVKEFAVVEPLAQPGDTAPTTPRRDRPDHLGVETDRPRAAGLAKTKADGVLGAAGERSAPSMSTIRAPSRRSYGLGEAGPPRDPGPGGRPRQTLEFGDNREADGRPAGRSLDAGRRRTRPSGS